MVIVNQRNEVGEERCGEMVGGWVFRQKGNYVRIWGIILSYLFFNILTETNKQNQEPNSQGCRPLPRRPILSFGDGCGVAVPYAASN